MTLVPASLLPFKEQYQQIANAMPEGSVLLSRSKNPRVNQILERVSSHVKKVGRRVTTLPVDRLAFRYTAVERIEGLIPPVASARGAPNYAIHRVRYRGYG